MIELRHLRYFTAVAEELHFGRAAARLGIAQPPLSQQIQRLERELGTTLFDRSSRQVALTDAGRALHRESGRILLSVDAAVDATRRAARGETGSITVAYAASVMFLTLPGILRDFRERFPDVQLNLREMPTAPQLDALHSEEIDVGFVREPPPDPRLHLETVMRERLVAAVSREHPLASRTSVSPADLSGERFVLFPREIAPGLHAQVHALCSAAGFAPNVVQESRELYTTVSLVEAGMGVTIIPSSVRKMGWTGVAYLPLPGPEAVTRIDMAWRVERPRPAVESFLDRVRAGVRRVGE